MQSATARQNTNGVDVARLEATIEQLKQAPELARFKFWIGNEWKGGGQSASEVKDFYGCGQEIKRQRVFTLVADEPDILLGKDEGANPVEYLLHALAACVTTSMVYHAAQRGIAIREVESTIEGDLDLRGVLGIEGARRNGYEQIRMKMRIRTDAGEAQVQELAALGPTFSPVFDSITKGVPVSVTAERMR